MYFLVHDTKGRSQLLDAMGRGLTSSIEQFLGPRLNPDETPVKRKDRFHWAGKRNKVSSQLNERKKV